MKSLSAQARKITKTIFHVPHISYREDFSYSGKMELFSCNIKKFLEFSQEKAFLMFQGT